MGQTKIRTLGEEKQEAKEKVEQKKKSEQKKLSEATASVGADEQKTVESKKDKKGKQKKGRVRSKKYQELKAQISAKELPLSEALEILEKLQRKTFDETVELHLNTKPERISVETSLPHGTGKALKVAVANDELIEQVEKGKVDFDILLAIPSMMPKLAKVAKVLGPRGLMPNPKNGTITNDPKEAMKKYESGLIFVKTEGKAPVAHIAVGKVSFGPKKLSENIQAVLSSVKKENISKAVLKSTQSPAIKLSL